MARSTRGTSARVSRRFRIEDGDKLSLKDFDPSDTAGLDKDGSPEVLQQGLDRLMDLQAKLYAQQEWALLIILQGLDAAGKDSVIKHVMSGFNPLGCRAYSFRAPVGEDLDHDYMWRHQVKIPDRGRIGIFNRSYYEEVLVVRVHPELLEARPAPARAAGDDIWDQRYKDIRAYERYLTHNAVAVRKFFLNVSREEQRKRFLERLDRPDKNWKFQGGDLKERAHWDEYVHAYEEMLRKTSTPQAPWYVVPADKKWFTRLVVADAVVEALEEMGLEYPKMDDQQLRQIAEARKTVEGEKD